MVSSLEHIVLFTLRDENKKMICYILTSYLVTLYFRPGESLFCYDDRY